MAAAHAQLLLAATVWMMPHAEAAAAAVLSSSTETLNSSRGAAEPQSDFGMLVEAVGVSHGRRKRAISPRDVNDLLDYHNRVRSQVLPPAANMEYMVRCWEVVQTVGVCVFCCGGRDVQRKIFLKKIKKQ